MSFKVEFQDVFSIADCEANPHKLYVFGDNLLRKGSGPYSGQAVIRGCKNAHGIATKREPSNGPQAFFSDKPEEFDVVEADFIELIERIEGYSVIVFPLAGIGTGRAKLPEKSPQINELIKHWVGHIAEHSVDT
jgi:hypothetical protein